MFLGFTLLFFSLYISSKSINATSDMIDNIENKQLKLSKITSKLNLDVKINQSNILQSIILNDTNSINNIYASFNKLQETLNTLESFTIDNSIEINGIGKTIDIVKRRMIGYKAVEKSLIEAIKTKDVENIEDTILGFNAITYRFSDDTNHLIKQTDEKLKQGHL